MKLPPFSSLLTESTQDFAPAENSRSDISHPPTLGASKDKSNVLSHWRYRELVPQCTLRLSVGNIQHADDETLNWVFRYTTVL